MRVTSAETGWEPFVNNYTERTKLSVSPQAVGGWVDGWMEGRKEGRMEGKKKG